VLATGYNVVDVEAALRRGITVTNVPAYSTDSVVQMTFAHLLNITNRIDYYARRNREGAWSNQADFCYWDEPLNELAGQTLGVVGLGNIGMKVATIALQLGCRVYALTSKDAYSLPEGITKTTLDGLLAASDIVTLHCPLTPTTRQLIRRETIDKMRPHAILINTGRGQLVNEADLAEALTEGRIGAYGADVMTDEPPRPDNPLLRCENAYITPHQAWASTQARTRLIAIAAQNLEAFISRTPQNVVNM